MVLSKGNKPNKLQKHMQGIAPKSEIYTKLTFETSHIFVNI